MKKPIKNARFRTVKALEVEGVIIFGAPCSGSFNGKLPAGEIMLLDYEPKSWAKGVWLKPERYNYFEQIFINEITRRDPEYDSYAVSVSLDELNGDYEQIPAS